MKKKTVRDFPRCAALDGEGRRCRKHSGIEHYYFGSHEHYAGVENEVAWVRINVCIEHAIATRYNFASPKDIGPRPKPTTKEE